MKKYIIFILSVISLSSYINAQVGINTKTPLGMLHIDSKNNSPGTTSDDIVFDTSGRLGIGTISPSARIHLKVPAGNKALRINDGTEADGRVLMSDANGSVRWGSVKGSGGSTMYVDQQTLFPRIQNTVLKFNGGSDRIPITADGNYLVVIRWWGRTTVVYNAVPSKNVASIYFNLLKNGTNVDNIEYYVPAFANSPFTLTTTLIGINCQVGDYLQLTVVPSVGGDWTINGAGEKSPSITIYRM